MRCGIAAFGIRGLLTRFIASILGLFGVLALSALVACTALVGWLAGNGNTREQRMDMVLDIQTYDSMFLRDLLLRCVFPDQTPLYMQVA
jgi:hypothetical protein